VRDQLSTSSQSPLIQLKITVTCRACVKTPQRHTRRHTRRGVPTTMGSPPLGHGTVANHHVHRQSSRIPERTILPCGSDVLPPHHHSAQVTVHHSTVGVQCSASDIRESSIVRSPFGAYTGSIFNCTWSSYSDKVLTGTRCTPFIAGECRQINGRGSPKKQSQLTHPNNKNSPGPS
jgi:hypothetical protein